MLSPRRSVGLFGGGYSPTTPVHPPSPTEGAAEPPTSAIPATGSRPSDVLANRMHEVKRITKSLVAYFEGISAAHTTHAATLLKLSVPSIIQSPLPESSLFLPTPATPHGQMGWADLLAQIRDNNKQVADEHAELAKTVTKSVVLPLKKLRVEIKAHVIAMEKEVHKLADVVLKERETTAVHLATLARSLAPPTTTTVTLPTPASLSADDPYLHRVSAETQLKAQTVRENELLKLVLGWQDKTEQLERQVWDKVAVAWRTWEETNSNLLLGNQQRSVLLSANVDSLPLDAEWTHFSKLNHILPRDTPPTDPSTIDYSGKDDLLTAPVRSGLLERQKRFVKTWKSGHFVLTPSGNLHEYTTSDAPLNKPAVSLHLPACTLGPMPESVPSPKGRPIEAMFTVEGPDSRNVFRAKSWEELSAWWSAIERYTKVSPVPLMSPPAVAVGEGDIGEALRHKAMPPTPEEVDDEFDPDAQSLPLTPPPLPPRHSPPASIDSGPLSTPSTPPSMHTLALSTPPTSHEGGDIGVPASPSPPMLTELDPADVPLPMDDVEL